MCDTSLNLPSSCPYNPGDRPSFDFLSYPASWKFLELQRGWRSSVRTVKGIRIIASRFSVTRSLTCKGLPSGIQKIVVIKCSPWRESGVHLQRMSALECVLVSPGRFRLISIGFIQRSVDYSNCVVHAHILCWRRVFKKTFKECKVWRF